MARKSGSRERRAAPGSEAIERCFAEGECILESGSRVRELYVIRSGRVCLTAGSGGETWKLGAGGLFGEITALCGTPAPYRAAAQEATRVLVLDLTLLNHLCRESAEFAFRLLRHLATQLGRSFARSAVAATEEPLDALGALAAAVLARSAGTEGPSSVDGKLRDLAESSGLPMMEAYRALHDLIDSRWLRLIDDHLTLLDRPGLEQLRG